MATTFVDYTGNGSATKTFSFPSFVETDIKVEVGGVLKSAGTHYNITGYTTTGGGNVVFTSGNIPSSPTTIRIYRDTDVDNAKATYTAGSSVKAGDLNNNQKQVLYSVQERQNQTITTTDIKDGAVTTAKLADESVTSAKIENATITAADIAADTILTTNLANNSITSAKIVDGTIASGDLGTDSVITAKIADDAVTYGKIQNVTASDRVLGRQTAGAGIVEELTPANIRSMINVEDGSTGDQTATEIKTLYESNSNTNAYIDTHNSLVGGITATATELNKVDGYTGSTANLNIVDGMSKATSLTSNSDTEYPTSKAVADYVGNTIAPLGGFEVIADEVSFPNTIPAAGVVISISDAGGVVINGSGVSTSGTTLGSSTVTINGFPSSLYGETLVAGVALMVSSTGASNTYNYHKILAKEGDVKQLSDDINDFNSRYRIASSAPSSSLDDGDLWFNTTSNKMKVYNASGSSWDDVAAPGNFFINTLSSSSGTPGTGGSATFNGSANQFTLSNPPNQGAAQVLASINGVIQKPNSGTSVPSEGFAIVSNDIVFSTAPASGADFFIITIGNSVNIGTPSNNTVTSAIIVDGAIMNVDVNTNAAIAGSKLADDSIAEVKLDIHNAPSGTDKYLKYTANGMEWAVDNNTVYTHPNHSGEVTSTGDGATVIASNIVDEDNLKISNAGSDGQYLQKQSGNTGGLTWASVSQTDTTYSISCEDGDNTDEEKIRLTAGGSGSGTDDVVLEAGTGLSIARSGDKITYTNTVTNTNTQLTEEEVEDFVGGMVTGNTETGITVTYEDSDGTLDFVVASQTDNNFTNTLKTKLDGIAASANNYVHPNHSGEVTSTADGATVIASDIVDEDNLKISNAGSNGQFLQKQSGNTGGLTWATVAGTITALNNQAANRLTTIGSTTTELDGEANLTFDGTTLAVTGNQTVTKEVQAQGFECPAAISADWSIGSNNNAFFPGPMTVNSGVTVTVPSGSTLTVV